MEDDSLVVQYFLGDSEYFYDFVTCRETILHHFPTLLGFAHAAQTPVKYGKSDRFRATPWCMLRLALSAATFPPHLLARLALIREKFLSDPLPLWDHKKDDSDNRRCCSNTYRSTPDE